ncbi:MAG TPA: S41 family peptidase [Candidatus Kapabacteria bacterium]|nr:S41 family peptidase [Candidatus Kapabacteria bacterium]
MKLILSISVFILSSFFLFSQPLYQTDNLDFEKGVSGGVPYYWKFPSSVLNIGYSAYLTDTSVYKGKLGYVMINPNLSFDSIPNGDPNECTVYQNINPMYYLNKKVRFSIYARLESTISKSRGELWIISKENKEKVSLSYFDTINVIKSNKWQKYTIEATIPANSTELRFGVLFVGGGKLYLDEANLEIINPIEYNLIENTALNNQQTNNIQTLAKIYSAMRYFLPSDNAQNTDWEDYLENYISRNLDSSGSQQFINNFIKPYENAVYLGKNKNASLLDKSIKEKNQLSYAMLYKGVPNIYLNNASNDFRKNIYSVTRRREGSISITADIIRYSGKELRVTSDMKIEGQSPGANAQIWAKVEITNSKEFVTKTSANEPYTDSKWGSRTLSLMLPENTYRVRLALVLLGEGYANFDNIKIGIYDNGKLIKEITDYNFDFEYQSSFNNINGWEIEDAVISAGYNFDIDKSTSTSGKKSLIISSDSNRVKFPKENSYYTFEVGDGNYFHINICSTTERGETLPESFNHIALQKPDSIFRNWNDVNARISALIQVYALLINFSANEINTNDLDSAFKYNLSKIISKGSFDYYLNTLQDFLLIAKDSRSGIWNSFVSYDYGIPLLFKKVENKSIVVQSYDDNVPISIGDEILAIDGIDIEHYLDSISNNFYSSNYNYKRLKAGAIIRSGLQDSKVLLKIKTTAGVTQDIEIKKTILLNNIYEYRPRALQQLNDSTIYIDMTVLDDNTLKKTLNQLETYKNFVFDLRGNAKMSEHILSLFSDTLLTTYDWRIKFYTYPFKENATSETFVGSITPKKMFQNKSLYFLINERSVGYSDFIAKIVKKHKLGLLIGTQTQGNPSEIVSNRLSGGFSVSLSSIICIDDSNQAIMDQPTNPDIKIEEEFKDIINDKDIFIEKTLEIINNK